MGDSAANDKLSAPTSLKATLHAYQTVGYKWLVNSYEQVSTSPPQCCCAANQGLTLATDVGLFDTQGVGGILGDAMGLGKTVQAISLMCHVADKRQSKPFLVISPLSVASNWCVSVRALGRVGAKRCSCRRWGWGKCQAHARRMKLPLTRPYRRACPMARCDELARFAPSLNVVLYTGDKQQREAVQQDNGHTPGASVRQMLSC